MSLALYTAGCAGRSNPVPIQPTAAPALAIPPTASTNDAAKVVGSGKMETGASRYPYTAADVQFMSHMIGHHSQAIVIAAMAPSHGASGRVKTLAERIINAQQDEIASMQMWLRDRNQAVPSTDAPHDMMDIKGMDHETMMPGMLTEAQLKQLDDARGTEFDRLFLTFMIRHHRGAVSMVEKLFQTQGAAQEETIFKLANDINVDQATEIDRMTGMLQSLESR